MDFIFTDSYLEGFQAVIEGDRRLGTLYLKSDLGGIYQRLRLLGITTLSVIVLSLLLAYVLSKIFQKNISRPILALAETAKLISLNRDFSVRAVKSGNDELGFLTDSFNGMLQQIQEQNNDLQEFNKKIERSERRFRLMIEKSTDMMILASPNGKLLYASPSVTSVLGYSEDEFKDTPVLKFIPRDDIPDLTDQIKQIINMPGKSFFWLLRLLHKDGSWVWCEGTVTNLLHEQDIEAFICNFRDITQRKEAEDIIVKSLKEVSDYKYAIDESSIVAITDQKGIIKYVNENFCDISKFRSSELLGQDHRIINSGYHTKDFMRNLWVTIAKGKIWRGELRNRAKDGTIYWVDTTIVPFLNEQGKPYQYVAIRADITGRKLAEDENRKLNEGLELRVKQRTEELEAFTYSVSHDLRTPLRAINGFAKMLDEEHSTVFDDEARRLFKRIEENAKKMGALIDDLLEFSKLGRKDIHKSPVQMTEIAKTTLLELNTIVNHKAAITIHPLHPANADITMIKQVMINLLSNAVKYSSKTEQPVIEIKSQLNGDEIVYSVSDNGVGFNNQYAGKLFGVFQRLHLQKDFEGTGVGLALVKRIIDKHGGRVWAEGELNKGATFFFSLPASNNN